MNSLRFLARLSILWLVLAAAGALHAATVLITLSTSASSLTAGQTATLTALVTGTSTLGVTWTMTPTTYGTLSSGNSADTSGYSINQYQAPSTITAHVTVVITATSKADTSKTASVSIVLTPSGITVSPSTASLYSSQTQQFTETGASSVTWSVSSGSGTIDSTGLYTAPSSISSSTTATIKATSTTDSAVYGTATVTLNASTLSVSPSSVTLTAYETQQFTATNNTGSSTVTWSISPSVGTIDQNGLYTAPYPITSSQKVTVTATAGGVSGTATVTLSTSIEVGSGASTTTLQQEFLTAFYRNNFNNLVYVPPQTQVTSFGGGVYMQKFYDAAKDSGVTYALATASSTVNPASDGSYLPVAQIYPDIYTLYSATGGATAGAAIMDTAACPTFSTTNSCTYQLFDGKYGFFAYASALSNGNQDLTITSTFYTEWNSLGGLGSPGLPITNATTTTASTATTASVQTYMYGAIYSITSGTYKGKIRGVIEPIWDVYVANSGAAGSLGFPIGEAVTYSSGVVQQNFEGGTLQYSSSGGGVTLLPVSSVVVSGGPSSGATTMSSGDTLTLTATVYNSSGTVLSNRTVTWVSTNSKVISVVANGSTAVLTAVAAGTASVLASAGGVSSSRITITVTSTCCSLGYGATATVQSLFAAAVTRDSLSITLPASDPATRAGSGYIQTLQSTSSSGTTTSYLLTLADGASTAYVVTGSLLTAYLNLGGPSGALGYPTDDASSGGTQLFVNGALGGSPVREVTGGVLTKWKALSYETGTAGAPTADATTFSTIGANSGDSQAFANGVIYAATAGPKSGKAYFVGGLILTAYNNAGGVSGDLGMPTSDASTSGGTTSQTFEGGTIAYASGAAAATVTKSTRVPTVTLSPSTVSAGGTVVVAITGFSNASTLTVSVTGQSNFSVTTSNGAYRWSMYLPLTSSSGTVTIKATDSSGTSSASATLTVKSLAAAKASVAKSAGDSQTGLPGALLPLPLTVAVTDSSGSAVGGIAVTFTASAGTLTATSVTTDTTGLARTYLRLPATIGTVLVTATAPSIGTSMVTFGAISSASTLSSFPTLTQSGTDTLGSGTSTIAQKGALLTAVASILQYHQNQGELAQTNGLATPALLNSYLTALSESDSAGNAIYDGYLSNSSTSGEQIVNLWRATDFTGGLDVTVLNSTATTTIADLIATGEPVLLSLGLTQNGATAGGHFVTAIGVASDGSLVIQDPNPLFARASLSDYLNGFTANGATWKGTVLSAVRFQVVEPTTTRFLAGALSQKAAVMSAMTLNITSSAGSCGTPLTMWDTVDASGNLPSSGALVTMLNVCDGAESTYQLDVGTSQAYSAFLRDLATSGANFDLSGSAVSSYTLTRSNGLLVKSAVTASFTASTIVNAADFAAGIAPGGIMAIFGTGLSGSGTTTAVDVDGVSATVLSASAFQVNAQVPFSTTAGTHTVRVKSAYGTVSQPVTVSSVAPAVFVSDSSSTSGSVLNQDNTLNSSTNPLTRGQTLIVYATGLGAVTTSGQYSVVKTTVTAVVNGTELAVAFAGLAPGYTNGLYQVNVKIPTTAAPGSGIPLILKQGSTVSNTVNIALQ